MMRLSHMLLLLPALAEHSHATPNENQDPSAPSEVTGQETTAGSTGTDDNEGGFFHSFADAAGARLTEDPDGGPDIALDPQPPDPSLADAIANQVAVDVTQDGDNGGAPASVDDGTADSPDSAADAAAVSVANEVTEGEDGGGSPSEGPSGEEGGNESPADATGAQVANEGTNGTNGSNGGDSAPSNGGDDSGDSGDGAQTDETVDGGGGGDLELGDEPEVGSFADAAGADIAADETNDVDGNSDDPGDPDGPDDDGSGRATNVDRRSNRNVNAASRDYGGGGVGLALTGLVLVVMAAVGL